MKYIVRLVATVIWIAGIVLAKGFASTALATLVPFWSFYVVIEYFLAKYF